MSGGRQVNGRKIYLAHAWVQDGYDFMHWWNVYNSADAAIGQAVKNARSYKATSDRINALPPADKRHPDKVFGPGCWEIFDIEGGYSGIIHRGEPYESGSFG